MTIIGTTLLYLVAPLTAILVYFHHSSLREEAEKKKNKFNADYDPDQTDCTVPLSFTKAGVDRISINLGPEFLLTQWVPRSINKIVTLIASALGLSNYSAVKTEEKTVKILDARKHEPGPFSETGFTLVALDKEPETKNWRPGSKDIQLFREQMEPYIKSLYPQTKRIEWLSNLVRGGDQPGDQPRALGPHLDYHQDDTERERFYQEFPLPTFSNRTEPHVLTGALDTEQEKLGVMLGIWVPLYPKQVMDYPLAVMDARTFKPENQILYNLHINMIFTKFNNLNGAISYNPDQKWYYYSKQSTTEVLIFHQYTKGRWMSNPHTSFLNKNCPRGTEDEERISAELRVALYF